ncbi:MAG: integration host factor subunit alpha [Syntrophobacterales bacterium]|jgi:integration host factor subunit alpha
MTLTKADIAKVIHNQVGRTKKQSAELVDCLFEIIKGTLEDGNDVLISGFGKFSIRERKERNGRNPLTGKPLVLAARKVVTFQCSGKLRNKINGNR